MLLSLNREEVPQVGPHRVRVHQEVQVVQEVRQVVVEHPEVRQVAVRLVQQEPVEQEFLPLYYYRQ